MKNKKSLSQQRIWLAATLTGLAMSTSALAQDVTLRATDDSLELTGKLIEANTEFYLIESQFGPIRVRTETVECLGDACPTLEDPQVARDADTEVTWDVSLWGKRRAFTEHVEKIAELVSEKTEGKFTLNISYGGLSDSRENLEGISEAKFEMAQFCAGYHRDKNPAITVLELPFLGVSSLEQEVDVSLAVYEHPATQEDMARWNATLLMPSPLPQYNLIGSGSPPTSLEGFKGMSIRATGGIGKAVEALGAELKSIPAPAVNEAMQKSEVTAVSFAPHAHMSFGTIENATWWTTNLNPGTVNCPVVVNTDALYDLPASHRLALLSSVDAAMEHYIDHYNGATMDAWWPALEDNLIIQLTFSDEILYDIKENVAGPVAAAWVEENTKAGLPAQELYDLVTRLLGKTQ